MDALILDPLQEERVTVTGRVLNIPESLQTVGVKTDNKVERIYFELPRYFDGFNDFSEFNFYINYINANGDGDVYYCDDLEIEDDNVVFSWLTDNKLYATKGTAHFTVRAMHSDGRKWNTTIAQLTILDGLETQEAVVEQDYDFINQQFEIIRQHTEKLNALIDQVKANTTNLDKAINQMGKADWNGNQVRFTDGLGNYGQFHDISGEFISRDEIYLGYAMSQDNPYSGHAGNYGIDVAKIVGSYKQDGTPTPDNPVEPQFNVINDFYTSGENLFNINGDVNQRPSVGSGSNTVENNILTSNVNLNHDVGIGQRINVLKGKTITFRVNVISLGTGISVGILIYDGGTKGKIQYGGTGIIEIKNYECKTDNIIIAFGTGGGTGGQFTDIMVNFGDTAQPYTPYVGSSTTPVSLELRALPDGTADVWEDGNTTSNVAKLTFDGSQNAINLIYVQNVGWAATLLQNVGLKGNTLLCNRFPQIDNWQTSGKFGVSILVSGSNTQIVFTFTDEMLETTSSTPTSEVQQKIKDFFTSKTTNVYYALSTPTTEPLEIPTLTSYYPFTNAWCDSELEPKLIEWHVNNKINYIEKLINEKQ